MFHTNMKKSTSYFGINPVCIFDETRVHKISCPLETSHINEYNDSFPRDKDSKLYVENSIYDMNNQPKQSMFKYDKEGIFCLGIAKVEILDGKITGKLCAVFYFMGGNCHH